MSCKLQARAAPQPACCGRLHCKLPPTCNRRTNRRLDARKHLLPRRLVHLRRRHPRRLHQRPIRRLRRSLHGRREDLIPSRQPTPHQIHRLRLVLPQVLHLPPRHQHVLSRSALAPPRRKPNLYHPALTLHHLLRRLFPLHLPRRFRLSEE